MTNYSMTREDQNKMLTSSRQLHSPHSTMIQYKFAKFLITDQPTRQNMDLFIKVKIHQILNLSIHLY